MTRTETKEIKYTFRMNIEEKENMKHILKHSSKITVQLPP